MKNNLLKVAVIIGVVISGLAIAHMLGQGGGCCGMSHQSCPMGMMGNSMGSKIENNKSDVGASGYCPVCLMQGMVMKGNDHFVSEYNGKVYKFSNLEMQKEFIENPDQFSGQALDDKIKQINK